MKRWLRAHGFTAFLGLACIALSAQVLVLAAQNRALKTTQAADPRSATLFQAGERFLDFDLRAAGGAVETLRFGGGAPRTLLFVLADACPICPQIVPRWEELAPHFLAAGTRVLGALLDAPARADQEWIEGVPLGSFADLTRVPLAKLKTVPITILIDAQGAIEWVHHGTLTDARLSELMSHL